MRGPEAPRPDTEIKLVEEERGSTRSLCLMTVIITGQEISTVPENTLLLKIGIGNSLSQRQSNYWHNQ